MSTVQEYQNPFQPEPARIVRQFDLIPNHRFLQVRHMNMDRAMSFTYRPGQFMMVSVPGVGESPFCLSSSPSRPGIIEFGIRRVGKTTKGIFQKKDNDTIFIRGPYGQGFSLEDMIGKDILIVAGGLGVMPLRSILYYVMDNRDQFGRVFFLYGARNPDEVLFKTEFFQLKERDDISCLFTVDKDTTGKWTENIGVVTTLFSKLPPIDPSNVNAIVCGPPVMYRFCIEKFLNLKIPKTQIQMSLERRMHCGIGKCGHCVLDHLYTCVDGPIFTYWDTLHFRELI